MASEPERSESGSPIYRHAPREREWEPAGGESALEQISDHIERHVGKIEMVYHELVSDLVHLDVHWIAPAPERNFHTLVTSGMSDRPMTVPEGCEELRYAELMLCLPPEWPMSRDSTEPFEDERNYWPIRWLKMLARLPHEYQTWLGPGHTVPNGDPPTPFAPNTELCCFIILRALTVPEEFYELRIHPEKTIQFWTAVPLYREEMEFKLKKGLDPLLDRLGAADVSEVLDVNRKNVCRKGGLFGWLGAR